MVVLFCRNVRKILITSKLAETLNIRSCVKEVSVLNGFQPGGAVSGPPSLRLFSRVELTLEYTIIDAPPFSYQRFGLDLTVSFA